MVSWCSCHGGNLLGDHSAIGESSISDYWATGAYHPELVVYIAVKQVDFHIHRVEREIGVQRT